MKRAQHLFKAFEERWLRLSAECEHLDYELALEDERYQKNPTSSIKTQSLADLSPEQLQVVIRKLKEMTDDRND